MVYEILEKDMGVILPKFEDREKNIKQKRQKRQIIPALVWKLLILFVIF